MAKRKFNPRRASIRSWRGHDYVHVPIVQGVGPYRFEEEVATIQSQDELPQKDFRAVMAYLRRAVRAYKKAGGK